MYFRRGRDRRAKVRKVKHRVTESKKSDENWQNGFLAYSADFCSSSWVLSFFFAPWVKSYLFKSSSVSAKN